MKKLLVLIFIIFFPNSIFADSHIEESFFIECNETIYPSNIDPTLKKLNNKFKVHFFINWRTIKVEFVSMNNNKSKKILFYEHEENKNFDHDYYTGTVGLSWYTLYKDKKKQEGWVNRYDLIQIFKNSDVLDTYAFQTMGKIDKKLFLETSNKLEKLIRVKQDREIKTLLEKIINANQEIELVHKSCSGNDSISAVF